MPTPPVSASDGVSPWSLGGAGDLKIQEIKSRGNAAFKRGEHAAALAVLNAIYGGLLCNGIAWVVLPLIRRIRLFRANWGVRRRNGRRRRLASRPAGPAYPAGPAWLLLLLVVSGEAISTHREIGRRTGGAPAAQHTASHNPPSSPRTAVPGGFPLCPLHPQRYVQAEDIYTRISVRNP